MYSGSKVSVELLNTRYLFKREMMQNFVEESLFLPIAEENGFYEVDEWGNKQYFYPKLSFTRLSIRDNAEVFDSLFQLYQKGSIPIDIILGLFNLDSDEVHEKLKMDMFTVKDAAYNDILRSVYNDIATRGVEGTKPDFILLKAQVRRATQDDQKKILEWLCEKFKLKTIPQ